MKRREKESKVKSVLTALLVVFVWLLSFSIGVISGKGWSDREHTVRSIDRDSHYQAAKDDTDAIGDEMSPKEVELLKQRAMEAAKAEAPNMNPQEPERNVANEKISKLDAMMNETMDKLENQSEEETSDKEESANKEEVTDKKEVADSSSEKPVKDESEEPTGREASTAKNEETPKQERKVSSLMPKPSTPKPTAVEYTVQVAAYKTLKEAEIHSEKLIDKGFPAFPVQAMIDGKPWYRVSIGSFKSKKQAIKYEKDLKKQAVVTNTFVQKIKRLKK